MSAITVNVVEKAFDAPVLQRLRFQLNPGERVALIGPSGCGKTTLLNLIAGLDAAYDGEITRPAGRIAMVFQTPRLLPWRTLEENIALVPGSGGRARARELLAQVGLADAAGLYPQRASLGMQRRAALARALATDPALILLDEPLVSLDPKAAAEMRDRLLAAFERTGAAVLLATHNRREALHLADRVIELGGSPATIARDRPSPLARAERQDPAAIDVALKDWFGPEAT